LRDGGMGAEEVLSQLIVAVEPVVERAIRTQERYDEAAYVALLDTLPVPTAADVEAALLDVVRRHPGIAADEADAAVLERLGRSADDELTNRLLDEVTEWLVDPDGPLAWLAGDRTVHVGDLTSGIVLTRRLSDMERQTGFLGAS